MGDVISSLLPVLDNLEKAVMAETKDEEYKKGIELVLKQFKDVLSANGVKADWLLLSKAEFHSNHML